MHLDQANIHESLNNDDKNIDAPSLVQAEAIVIHTRLLTLLTREHACLNLIPFATQYGIPHSLNEEVNDKLVSVEMELFSRSPEEYEKYAKLEPHRNHACVIGAVLFEEWNELLRQIDNYKNRLKNAHVSLLIGIKISLKRIEAKLKVTSNIGLDIQAEIAELEQIYREEKIKL